MKPPGSSSSNTPLHHTHVACLLVPCSRANSYGSGGHPFVSLEFKKNPHLHGNRAPPISTFSPWGRSHFCRLSPLTRKPTVCYSGPSLAPIFCQRRSHFFLPPLTYLGISTFTADCKASESLLASFLQLSFRSDRSKETVGLHGLVPETCGHIVQRCPCPDLICRVCCCTRGLPGTIVWLPLCLTLRMLPFLPSLGMAGVRKFGSHASSRTQVVL